MSRREEKKNDGLYECIADLSAASQFPVDHSHGFVRNCIWRNSRTFSYPWYCFIASYFVLLLAIWIGGVSGTFISAVLIGIPGSSSAIATCFDGFPMTKKGQAGKALGIGMTASFIGTVVSVIIATVLSPVIAEFALHLGPWEYFTLCFCAI